MKVFQDSLLHTWNGQVRNKTEKGKDLEVLEDSETMKSFLHSRSDPF